MNSVIDLSEYECIEVFYPYLSSSSDFYPTILEFEMVEDPLQITEYASPDRTHLVIFESSGNERDSSGDKYSYYRKINGR